ncbi:mutS protein homolog 5-like [Physella acuta]|uniref:mutS protein homolog 5-like n=1 Tax=Physella acuta TaxID=109671 RepID=UPI0027DBEC94|nr:mutS protein homolog 5-like [Physella acuta]
MASSSSTPGVRLSLSSLSQVQSMLDTDGEDDENDGRRTTSDTSYLNAEVYAAVMWHGGQLGVCYYDLNSLQIHVMPDTLESDDFSLVKQILREIQPSVIVLSALQDNRLLTCLKQLVSNTRSSPGIINEACRLEFLPNSDFNYEVGKRRILAIKLPSIPNHYTEDERKVHFSSLVSFERTNMIRSIGGLLKYLDKTRVGVELEDTDMSVPVLGFRLLTLENQIQIDAPTYCALNIFHMEFHPSVYKFGSSSKEGLSLFGILNRCKSSIGTKMLRQWFLRPLRNAMLLNQRYDAISFFLEPRNTEIVNCLQSSLKHIKFIPKILSRMSKAQATIGDWVALFTTIYYTVYIGDLCKNVKTGVEIFKKVNMTITDDLHRCANLICKTINFEESKQKKRFVVQPNVDETLDEKKRTFNGLPDLMTHVAREELKSLSSEISECVVSYLPQIGYLLVIDMPEGKEENDDHTIDGLEFKFASNNQLFYKTPKTLELDTILGDTQLDIIEMEINIMHRLQTVILENTQVLLDVTEVIAELDCLMALAVCAQEFGYVRPNLVKEDVIDIKAGRHPLQELCCSPFVPNHAMMGGESGKIKLLTGPNACGKSVYLKQVALIVYMVHIGSFAPAEQANIGPIDQIFSRIKTFESISEGMSTFMQENMQMTEALRLATANSLVIVDEYGQGTESTDGLSLLTAILKFWIAKGTTCPFVLVSTHFHSIIHKKLLPSTAQLQYLTLETVMNNDELVFLYQIREGHTSTSYACNIAAHVGMPASVIQRGKEVSDLLAQYKSVPHMRDSDAKKQHESYEKIVEAFLKLDLDKDDLQGFLKDFVLKTVQNTEENILQPVPKYNEVPQIKATHRDKLNSEGVKNSLLTGPDVDHTRNTNPPVVYVDKICPMLPASPQSKQREQPQPKSSEDKFCNSEKSHPPSFKPLTNFTPKSVVNYSEKCNDKLNKINGKVNDNFNIVHDKNHDKTNMIHEKTQNSNSLPNKNHEKSLDKTRMIGHADLYDKLNLINTRAPNPFLTSTPKLPDPQQQTSHPQKTEPTKSSGPPTEKRKIDMRFLFNRPNKRTKIDQVPCPQRKQSEFMFESKSLTALKKEKLSENSESEGCCDTSDDQCLSSRYPSTTELSTS